MNDFPEFNAPQKVEKTTLERDVQERCVRLARARGWWARKLSTSERADLVDYIFGKDTWVEWVEFKRPGLKRRKFGGLSPGQNEEHQLMRQAGMTPVVFDDVIEFQNYIGLVEDAMKNLGPLSWAEWRRHRCQLTIVYARGEDQPL